MKNTFILSSDDSMEIVATTGYASIWDAMVEGLDVRFIKVDEEGNEVGADLILTETSDLGYISYISADAEDQAPELGDRIGAPELCLFEEEDTTPQVDYFVAKIEAIKHEKVVVEEGAYRYLGEEQKALNESYFMNKMEDAADLDQLAEVVKTLESWGEMVRGKYFFIKGGYSRLFSFSYTRKQEIIDHKAYLLIMEIVDEIKAATTIKELALIKMKVYDYDRTLLIEERQKLWALCDQRRLEIIGAAA
jgi:hypothetical protein